jgi:hypothetical protein
MTANVQPVFGKTPLQGLVQISTANTNRDGTGTIGTVATAGADGAYIERVEIEAAVATTAGVIRLFINDGTNTRLIEEILVTAITPSASVAAYSASSARITAAKPLFLPSGWSLRASTHNGETFNVLAVGAQNS